MMIRMRIVRLMGVCMIVNVSGLLWTTVHWVKWEITFSQIEIHLQRV